MITRRARATNNVGPALQVCPQRRDRIALLKFLTFFYLGGTERQVMNLAAGIDPERFDLHMGCNGKVGELLDEATALGVPVTEYAIDSLYNVGAIRARIRLAGYLRKHSIEILHSYGFYSNLFAIPAARLAGVPVIVASIRDCGEMLTPMQKRAQKLFCRMADCILANAEGVRRSLIREGYPAAKIQVIRNGIGGTVAPAGAGNAGGSWLRHELGFPADTRLIAVCSRLNPMKGLEYFLDAAATVSQTRPDVRFLIVGGNGHRSDGTYQGVLERYAASRGLEKRVVFTGFRTDVSKMLREIDITVLPSLSEGLSNSLLESMAEGVPVIATKVGGTPELVEDGSTGLLVPPRDPVALSQSMTLLLDNPATARRIGEAGRSYVHSRFSMDRMVQETQTLYAKLLGASRARVSHREAAML